MPSTELHSQLKALVESTNDCFEDRFEVEWNLFTSYCMQRSLLTLKQKDDAGQKSFKKQFMDCKSTEQRLKLLFQDKQLNHEIRQIYRHLEHGSAGSGSQKNSVIATTYLKCARKLRNNCQWKEALEQTNRAILHCPSYEEKASNSHTFLMIKIVLLRAEVFIEQAYFKDARSDMSWAMRILNECAFSSESLSDIKCSTVIQEKPLLCSSNKGIEKLAVDKKTEYNKNLQNENISSKKASKNDTFINPNQVAREYWKRRLLHLQILLQHLQKPAIIGSSIQTSDVPDWTYVDETSQMENKYYEMKLSSDRKRLEKIVEKRGREIRSQRIQRESLMEPKIECLNENSQLPGARQCLELKDNSYKGRHVITNQPLPAGQLLFVEEPIVSWLRSSMYLHYCGYCLSRLKGHFVPCIRCTNLIFCNEQCRDNAWAIYHGQECSKLYHLRYLAYGHMALRLLIIYGIKQFVDARRQSNRTRSDKNLNANVFEEFLDKEDEEEIASECETKKEEQCRVRGDLKESEEKTLFQKELSTDLRSLSSVDSENVSLFEKRRLAKIGSAASDHDFKTFYSLVNFDQHLSFEHLLSFLVMVGVLGNVAQNLNLVEEWEDHYLELCAALFDCILKINFNCYLISDHKVVSCGESMNLWAQSSHTRKIGIGVYASSSMISHSCDCNSIKIALGSKIIIYTIKPLIKDEEVTITYGPHYQKNTLKDRRRMLADSYLFHCECNACKNGWENLCYAYQCNSCEEGAVVWFERGGGYCTRCEIEFPVGSEVLKQMFERSENAQKCLEQALEALKARDLAQCKLRLHECNRHCHQLFYTNHKLFPLYSAYIEYYELRHKFEKARKYTARMTEIQLNNSGKNSLEWINSRVQELVLLMREIQRQRKPQVKRAQLRQLEEQLKECEQLLHELNKQEILCAQRHYFDALPLSQALRRFLTEESKSE